MVKKTTKKPVSARNCPFCGRKASILSTVSEVSGNVFWWVECSNNVCRYTPSNRDAFHSRAIALDWWNGRRVPERLAK